jgi:hypothetical protein
VFCVEQHQCISSIWGIWAYKWWVILCPSSNTGQENTSWKIIYLCDSDRLTLIAYSTMTWARSEPSNHTIVQHRLDMLLFWPKHIVEFYSTGSNGFTADAAFWMGVLYVSLTLKRSPWSVGYTHVISPRIQKMYWACAEVKHTSPRLFDTVLPLCCCEHTAAAVAGWECQNAR